MQIVIVPQPLLITLDAVGPSEMERPPDADIRTIGTESGSVVADSGVQFLPATHTYAETVQLGAALVPDSSTRTAATMDDSQPSRYEPKRSGASASA